MDSVSVYECHNESCTLGTRSEPGRFSGGASQHTVMLITGDPEREYGEGICPNCCTRGEKVEDNFTPAVGEDPNQDLHDAIAAKTRPQMFEAMDPSNELTIEDYRDRAMDDQAKLEAAVEKREGDNA